MTFVFLVGSVCRWTGLGDVQPLCSLPLDFALLTARLREHLWEFARSGNCIFFLYDF